jgi:periplasmic protein TonB
MFTNLIESDSHRKEYKRRGSFFLITVAAYAIIIFAAGIASVYAYDAQLEAQTSSLELLNWVPPVTPEPVRPIREVRPAAARRSTPSNAPVDPTATRPERTTFVSSTNNPTKVPDSIGVVSSNVPVYTEGAVISNRNVNPPSVPANSSGSCVSCPAETPRVEVDAKPPEPTPVKPKTERVPSSVLTSKAISLPQPTYPAIARPIRLQGAVTVQILVDEQGRVISAQVVSGHPILSPPARDAALRARFTPTVLNGQAVKIQGVITYNFVMQ